MLYQMIKNKRDKWFDSNECTVKEMISYIENKGEMRDAQIEAIKTYLFLKIKCENKPLWELMYNGEFNVSLNLNNLELKESVRNKLKKDKGAMALYQYSLLKDSKDNQPYSGLEKEIKKNADKIDFKSVIQNLFYNEKYTDYLFSLPMGAGKTFLMATFIYLDLYFALNEPENKVFAHNFIVFAPSGLKSSVVPSLRSIRDFDATWILPEEAAKQVKDILKFEVLDEDKSTKKSNKAKNPNVQKIANHQPFNSLMGLVMVTNAEKVILNAVQVQKGQASIFDATFDEKDKVSNELRNFIGKVPNLQIIIDEVHHTAKEEIKLNKVVNDWMENGDINSVIGFSGTPYYEGSRPITIYENYSIKIVQMTNTVYFYSLINAIGNFLKIPEIKAVTERDSLLIVEKGLRHFFENYKDKVYDNGTTAKLAIYSGRIATLREEFYPKCVEIAKEYGFNPDEVILAYHGKDSKGSYSCSKQDALDFATLDTPSSKKRIVLLAQIGKEGWDCKSLAGVILSQKGDSPKNMVLQTSSRCLRQVDRNKVDSATIWLNDYNAKILDEQLKKEHNTSIQELNNIDKNDKKVLRRYDRTKHLSLPKLDFYQLKVEYKTLILEDKLTIEQKLNNIKPEKFNITTTTTDIEGNKKDISVEDSYGNEVITFNRWIFDISKESFNNISIDELFKYEKILTSLFNKIVIQEKDYLILNKLYDNYKLKSDIRKAFLKRRSFETHEDIIPESKSLINTKNFKELINSSETDKFKPNQKLVESIMLADRRGSLYTKEQEKQIDNLKKLDMEDVIEIKFQLPVDVKSKDKTYHYLPYNFSQSGFEMKFFEDVLSLDSFKNNDLEIYYNGDRGLTEFKIKCYKKQGKNWSFAGMYTPDFLIIKRVDGNINQALIIETKGAGFKDEQNFISKKAFVKEKFLELNNNKYGYERFNFFYVEDSEKPEDIIGRIDQKIKSFFKRGK